MRGNARGRKDPEVCKCVKYYLYSSNFFFWIVGGTICLLGVWSRASYSTQSESIGLLTGWDLHPAYILIGVGGFIFFLGFCGCASSGQENVCVLKGYAILLSIGFFVLITFGAIGFLYRLRIEELTNMKLTQSIIEYKSNFRLQKIIDEAQMTFTCCGLNGPDDWQMNVYFNCSSGTAEACSVPFSCCRKDPLNTMCGHNTNSVTSQIEWRSSNI